MPEGIRTPDPRLRRPLLYPAELQTHKRVMGIEPTYLAWKASVLPLNYTRTRDFYREFAEALSHADRVVLLPIYPAREEPIPGVESEMIGRLLTVPWTICDRAELAEKVAAMDTDVVVSFGAGNIDACCGALAEKLREKA